MDIKIIVVEQKAGSKSVKSDTLKNSSEDEQTSVSKKLQNGTKNIIKISAAISTAMSIPMQMIIGEIDYQISGIKFETGDSDYAAHVQQKFNNVVSYAKMGITTAGAGLAGFAYGGVIGAIAAVGVIATTTVIQDELNKAKFNREYNFNLQADNFKTDYNRARSGTFVYGGGRER